MGVPPIGGASLIVLRDIHSWLRGLTTALIDCLIGHADNLNISLIMQEDSANKLFNINSL